MKSILCYGDSNTWGYVPMADHSSQKQRYAYDVRWPGHLQGLLGQDYYVIEEGLNSRTTNVDHTQLPDRNGKTYFEPCLYTHAPLDLVIIALGGNDTKTYFDRDAAAITSGLEELVDIVQTTQYGPELIEAPKVLLLSPVMPMPFVEEYYDEEGVPFMEGCVEKTKGMIKQFGKMAARKGCGYIDMSESVLPSEIDGVHYGVASHAKCAELVGEWVKGNL